METLAYLYLSEEADASVVDASADETTSSTLSQVEPQSDEWVKADLDDSEDSIIWIMP